jgi:predicted site-specific integrase-resolvase
MSPGDVQEMLGITRKTLNTWAKNGLIPFIPLPSGHRRYLRSEIEAYVRRPRSESEAYQVHPSTSEASTIEGTK